MAVSKKSGSTKTVAKVNDSPLNLEQVLRASKALIGKLNSDSKDENSEAKVNLLADADVDDTTTPVWLVLSTKRHISDKTKLKPGKIVLPHPYIKSEQTEAAGLRVCLITTDPQRRYKDIVEHPNFPAETRKLIAKVIDLGKLKAKFNSYETKRKLASEYDVFLADDRIITQLPKILGKVFYKASSKRPVPVQLAGRKEQDEQSSKRRKLAEGGVKIERAEPKPSDIAAEIERALSSALIHVAPSASTSVKVGIHTQPAEHLQSNIQTVIDGFVESYVPEKWSGVKAIHIKGPNTVALPIWQTDELWLNKEKEVLKEIPQEQRAERKRKRSALSEATQVLEVPGPDGKMRQVEKPKTVKSAAPEKAVAKPKRTRMKAADLI